MNQETGSSKPVDNLELLKQEAERCGPGCGCHNAEASGMGRWAIGIVILLAAAALIAKAVLKKDAPAVEAAAPAFARPVMPENSAEAMPVAPTPPAIAATSQADLAKESLPATPAVSTPEAEPAGTIVGKEIGALAELNKVATDASAVFVYLPVIGPNAGKSPTDQLQAAASKIEAQGSKVGLFTLKASSPDHQMIARQVALPAVIAMVKGGGMNAVSGEITETKLIQSFVAAASAGGCGPSGCGPSGCR